MAAALRTVALAVSFAAAAMDASATISSATISAASDASVTAAAPWERGGFTEAAMANVSAVREQIKALPFLQELVAGTLPKASFAFYLTQDSLYLRQYAKVLAALALRAPTVAMTQTMARAADTALVVEGALHEGFLSALSPEERRQAAEPSPTCAAYTNHLQSLLAFAPYEVRYSDAHAHAHVHEPVHAHAVVVGVSVYEFARDVRVVVVGVSVYEVARDVRVVVVGVS